MLTFILFSILSLIQLVDARTNIVIGGSVGGVAGLIILILDIIACVEILRSARDIFAKLLWILLIVFFPIGGLLIYLCCGRRASGVDHIV